MAVSLPTTEDAKVDCAFLPLDKAAHLKLYLTLHWSKQNPEISNGL